MKDSMETNESKAVKAERHSLIGRIVKYQNILIEKGIKIAKEKGIGLIVVNTPLNFQNEDTINIYEDEYGADVRKLIDLAKETNSSLYRKYNSCLARFNELSSREY
jgi:hypothetical protein